MRANLNSLGEGIIVLGLGAFLLSIAIVAAQPIFSSPSTPSSFNTLVAGFFALSMAVVLAGILKIASAIYRAGEEKGSTLKTAVVASLVALVVLYYTSFAFLFRYGLP